MDKDKSNKFKKIIYFVIIIAVVTLFFINNFYGTIAAGIFLIFIIYKLIPSLYMLIGKNRYSVINANEGFKWFEIAYNTKKLSVNNQVFYAYLLLKHKNVDKSEIILEKLTHFNLTKLEEANVFLNYSLVLWKKGDNEKSLEYAEYAYGNIKNTVIYGTLGFLKIEFCSIEEALKFNEEAFLFNSLNQVICDNYALALINSGNLDSAEQLLNGMISKGPNFPEPYYNLGCLYFEKGKVIEAKECFEKALTFNFSFLSSLNREQVDLKLYEASLQQEKFLP